MRVLVAGGTGFIGRAVVAALRDRGDEAMVATRTPREPGQVDYQHLPEHADAVVNLAGEWVAGLWTPAKKREIIRSRVETTRAIVDWMLDCPDHLPVLVSSSAVGYYGHRPGEVLTEESAYDPRDAFRGRVCKAWEAEALRAKDLGARVVLARIGGVLDMNGGLIKLFEPLMRRAPFLIPPAADKQLSWISLEDTVGLILFALDHPSVHGPLNLTAPKATTYGQFVAR
ncbi:MAG: NAD-dependent epimerase/dehydratase family protein, partial [Fimbriimonas sp.]